MTTEWCFSKCGNCYEWSPEHNAFTIDGTVRIGKCRGTGNAREEKGLCDFWQSGYGVDEKGEEI